MAHDLDLQAFDPVCPTCHAPWAGIERLVAEVRALRETGARFLAIVDAHATGSFGETQDAFREALDAARRTPA